MDKPRRRYVFIAKVEGDTREDLAEALQHLARQVEREQLSHCSICGGPSNSHIASLTIDETVTHDSYFAALEVELETIRAREVTVAPPVARADEPTLDEVAARR